MFPVGRSGVEVPANDAEQALIGRMRALQADGMSFARIAGQRSAVKLPTTRGAWMVSMTTQENPRPGSVTTGRVRPAHFAHEHGAGTMAKKRGDDQYGYDPDRATARSLFDHLEQQAEQRPDK
jgi:hypothetical protein